MPSRAFLRETKVTFIRNLRQPRKGRCWTFRSTVQAAVVEVRRSGHGLTTSGLRRLSALPPRSRGRNFASSYRGFTIFISNETRGVALKAMILKSFGGPEPFKLTEVPKAVAEAGLVLVQVHATSINPLGYQVQRGDYRHHVQLPAIPFTTCPG